MKLKIKSDQLAKALHRIGKITAPRSPLPILGYTLAKADQDGITLQATDLETFLTIPVNGDVIEEGKVCMPAKFLADIIATIDADTFITLSTDPEEEGILTLEWKGGKYRLNTRDTDEFPIPPIFPAKNILSLGEFSLREALSHAVIFVASHKEQRAGLRGVNLLTREDKILVQATDSHRAYRTSLEPEDAAMIPKFDVIIPGVAVRKLISILSKYPGDYRATVAIDEQTRHLFIRTERGTISIRLVEAKFPNVDAVINKPEFTFTLPSDEIQNALKRVLKMAADRDTPDMVTWSLDGHIILTSNSLDNGDGFEQVEFPEDSNKPEKPEEWACNGAYVLDALRIFGSDPVTLGFTSPTHLFYFTSEFSKALAIVMPMVLRKTEEAE